MKMKKSVTAAVALGVIVGLMSSQSHAQLPVIDSLSLSGELVCVGLKPGSTATVEWAPTVNGPWTNTWAGLEAAVAGTDGTIQVKVPMFYRVRGEPQTVSAGMVWIPAATFTMGSPSIERGRGSDEGPQTVVTLTKGFWLGKYEVTQREYVAVMGDNPSRDRGDLERPVEMVTWFDAVEYCNRLTTQEQAAGRLPAGYEYRLPTEAQWEYACRAGTTTRFSFADALECDDGQCGACPVADQYMWWCGNSGDVTYRVGQKLANGWGLHDMHGNVWEWCGDWTADSYPGGSVTDPMGPGSGYRRVIRGGACDTHLRECRSARRNWGEPASPSSKLGFRVALVAVP